MPFAWRIRTKVSPSTEFRTWPICAALFGLTEVCSTQTFREFSAATARGSGLAAAFSERNFARSKKTLRYPAPATSTRSTKSNASSSVFSASANSRGFFFSPVACLMRLASSNATGKARSPSSVLGGTSQARLSSSTPKAARAVSATRVRRVFCRSRMLI